MLDDELLERALVRRLRRFTEILQAMVRLLEAEPGEGERRAAIRLAKALLDEEIPVDLGRSSLN